MAKKRPEPKEEIEEINKQVVEVQHVPTKHEKKLVMKYGRMVEE